MAGEKKEKVVVIGESRFYEVKMAAETRALDLQVSGRLDNTR